MMDTERQENFPGQTFYERAAAWERIHGRDWQIEAWENPARWRRFLETGRCDCHPADEQDGDEA